MLSQSSIAPNPILNWLSKRHDDMAALLSELIAIPTENPPGKNYRACVDLLERHLTQAHLTGQRLAPNLPNAPDGYTPECLLATCGKGKRLIYFHGHYDVVPAQSPEQFQPSRREHFLFGRGSCDMKGGIVAMFFAIRALQETGAPLNGRIGLVFVPNEETGGHHGTAWLAQQGLLDRSALGMLLPEPTGGVVWNANRGAISLRVRVHGKSAHVALQHRGENSFERMHRVVAQLQQLKHEVEQRKTKVPIGPDQSPNSILMLGGQSGGGTNFNVVPGECWFTIDRRINPEENLAVEKAALLALLERCRQDGIPLDSEIFQEGDSSVSDAPGTVRRALTENIQTVTGAPARFEMCPGLLENRFYAALGIPAFAYGPGLLSAAHGPNEYVDLRKVADTAAIYALTALNVLQ
jgi:acetylornithine deacetylase/succinyl-diaminopimelate desuccinylase family protein